MHNFAFGWKEEPRGASLHQFYSSSFYLFIIMFPILIYNILNYKLKAACVVSWPLI